MSRELVTAALDSLLKPVGFVRRAATWNRQSNSLVDAINVQKAGDSITVNVGVFYPDAYRKCWGREPPAFVDEAFCTVRTRVGRLLDRGELWWRLDDPGTVDDVVEKIRVYVLPFLEGMHTLDAMEQFLTASQVTKPRHPYPPPIIYLAILKDERGDKAGACALLTELGKKTLGAWKVGVREVAERLGCP
jgi:hypothetical protein